MIQSQNQFRYANMPIITFHMTENTSKNAQIAASLVTSCNKAVESIRLFPYFLYEIYINLYINFLQNWKMALLCMMYLPKKKKFVQCPILCVSCDNPRASEFTHHLGCSARNFCRTCDVSLTNLALNCALFCHIYTIELLKFRQQREMLQN